jgi:hypothetical protein
VQNIIYHQKIYGNYEQVNQNEELPQKENKFKEGPIKTGEK